MAEAPGDETAGNGWGRREFVRAAALLGVALGAPGCVSLATLDPAQAPTEGQLAMLREVAQIVIPRSDTAGAGDAGVGAFVALALAHGLDGTRAQLTPAARDYVPGLLLNEDGSLRYLDWLEEMLGAGWFDAQPDTRVASVIALDLAAFAPAAAAHPWRKLKGLILTGYYTSQAGGAQELRYEPLPRRFDPAVPLVPGARAISNDWSAVEFG